MARESERTAAIAETEEALLPRGPAAQGTEQIKLIEDELDNGFYQEM